MSELRKVGVSFTNVNPIGEIASQNGHIVSQVELNMVEGGACLEKIGREITERLCHPFECEMCDLWFTGESPEFIT
jgi:hypothetical protein